MPSKTISGSLWTAIAAMVTALVPLFMQLTSNTDEKIDVSYELLKQKAEFHDKEISALRDDIREMHQYLLQTMKEIGKQRNAVTPTEAAAPGRSGVHLASPEELNMPEALPPLPAPPELTAQVQKAVPLPANIGDAL